MASQFLFTIFLRDHPPSPCKPGNYSRLAFQSNAYITMGGVGIVPEISPAAWSPFESDILKSKIIMSGYS